MKILLQIKGYYQCLTCNVLVGRKFLEHHLKWPNHVWNTEKSVCDDANKFNDSLSEYEQIEVVTQKEKKVVEETDDTKVHFDFVIERSYKASTTHTSEEPDNNNEKHTEDTKIPYKRQNKIVIGKTEVFKIKWENWHGLVPFKNGFKCKLCTVEIGKDDSERHVEKSKHKQFSDKPFAPAYYNELVRQVC